MSKKNKDAKKGLRQSKTEDFLKNIRNNNSMIDYLTDLRIMNPAAQVKRGLNEPRREGGFVRLAHAREEFTAPVLTKGKSVQGVNTTPSTPASKRKKAPSKKR